MMLLPFSKLWPSARHVEVAAFTAFGRHVSVDGATGTQASDLGDRCVVWLTSVHHIKVSINGGTIHFHGISHEIKHRAIGVPPF